MCIHLTGGDTSYTVNSLPLPTQVDFLTFTGQALTTANATLAAVQGSSAQAMTCMTTAYELLFGLIGAEVERQEIASSVVQTTFETIKQLNSSKAALTTQDGLTQLYTAAYMLLAEKYAGESPPDTRRLLRLRFPKISQLKALIAGTAKVSDAMHKGLL